MTPKGQWLLSQPPLFGDGEAVLNNAGKHRTVNPHAVELGTLELPPETQMWLCLSLRMPIVLGTFTSSSRKFVDLSYRALLFIDAKKELNSLVAMNAR